MGMKEQLAQRESRHGELIALTLLIVIVSIINIIWIQQDTRPQPEVDSSIYLRKLLIFADSLRVQGALGLWDAIGGLSMGGRSPLYQLLSLPYILAFGRSADAALSVNILFGTILLLATYNMGRLVLNGKAGLLAAFLVATYPPIVGLSRIYRPNFATPACVALSLWLLLLLLKTRSVKVAWLFGASLGFGMLVRHFFVLHLLVPTVVFGIYVLLFQTNPRLPPSFKETPRWLLAKLRDPFVLRGLLPAALIAAGLTATWYLSDAAAPLFTLQQRIQEGEQTATRGFKDIASYSFWWYVVTAPGAISYFFAFMLVLGIIVNIFRRKLANYVLIVTFLASYVFLSLQKGLGWMRFAAVLPVIAVITAVGIFDIRSKLVSKALTLACVAIAAFNFSVVTWGVKPWSEPVAIALGAQLHSHTCEERMLVAFCDFPAREEDWRLSDVLQTVLSDSDCQDHACRLMLVSGRGMSIKSGSVYQYYLALDFPKADLKIVDDRRGTPSEQMVDLLESEFVLHRIPSETQAEKYNDRLSRFLESPPPAFSETHERVASFTLPDGQAVALLKRTAPLTIEEARASIAATALSTEDTAFLQEWLSSFVDIDAYRQAAEANPGSADRWQDLAEALSGIGQYEEAISAYEQAIALAPERVGLYVQLSRAYLATGQSEQAIAQLELAVALAPDNPWPRRVLAGTYGTLGQTELAIDAYRQVVEIAPEDIHSHFGLAMAYEAQGMVTDAIREYRAVIDIDPDSNLAERARQWLANRGESGAEPQ